MGMKKKVVIFGAGVGGLSAAHELSEGARGAIFDIELIENRTIGGKALSEIVKGSPASPNGYPGEHGFRFFPAFYRHVVDTMQRIPSAWPTANRRSVLDHLVPTGLRMLGRFGKSPIVFPSAPPIEHPERIATFLLQVLGADTGLTLADTTFFTLKLLQLATSSKARRIDDYQKRTWWDYMQAGNRSPAYQRYLAKGLTRTLVAASPTEANAKTGGDVLVRMLFDSFALNTGTTADRVLDGPTNEVWIKPWVTELRRRGVTFTSGELKSLRLATDGASLSGAEVEIGGVARSFVADYYILALPVVETAEVLNRSPAVKAANARLAGVADILLRDVRSMSGLQFYLDRPLASVDPQLGHALYIDTPWALTSITQSAFWRTPFDDLSRWGSGNVKTVWSIDASDWKTADPMTGDKDAEHCSRDELGDFTLKQLAASLNGDGVQRFDPASVLAWNLDSSVTPGPEVGQGQAAMNTRKLQINTPCSWDNRPDAAPAGIANLMVAADYVRTNTDLASMEGANEAARRAVNAIMDREGVDGERCRIFELYFPEVLAERSALYKEICLADQARHSLGLDWDIPGHFTGLLQAV
jgi:uncharacterized protein with NAD-binding domain and iron-sulfur cluster